jgi:cobalt-precorrin 5A hydrolase/precorrin-3B C17-methyltransferase
VVAKTKSARATCAIARAADDIDPAAVGRPRGHLAIVGIGPGDAGWRTADATMALSRAEDVVGLPLYLDLIADLIAGKRRHATPLSEETARARRALELAAEGRRVALVSSGDAGLYGLASLVFECLDLEDRADWNRIEITVHPGVSAFQAASARLGAITGHDICLISLSDLLTPWAAIERRLAAAADGDFVVALYNPVSARRRSHLPRARDLLLAARPPDTPVILARQLTRPGESLEIIRLADLQADHADMLTLVVVGSSASRIVRRGARTFVYTPRGYAGKAAASRETETPS